jgi:hypothetical protein
VAAVGYTKHVRSDKKAAACCLERVHGGAANQKQQLLSCTRPPHDALAMIYPMIQTPASDTAQAQECNTLMSKTRVSHHVAGAIKQRVLHAMHYRLKVDLHSTVRDEASYA